jgi:hypothetical protein
MCIVSKLTAKEKEKEQNYQLGEVGERGRVYSKARFQ